MQISEHLNIQYGKTTFSKMVAPFFSKRHYITLDIIIPFESSWYLFVCFQVSPLYYYFSSSHFKHILEDDGHSLCRYSLKVSSFSWEDSTSASTPLKATTNTVKDWLNYGLMRGCIYRQHHSGYAG